MAACTTWGSISTGRLRSKRNTAPRSIAAAATGRTVEMGEAIHAGAAPQAVGVYPHARRVGGLLFLSGIGPRDPQTDAIAGNEYFADGRVRKYDIEAQARAVFANVRAVLEAAGARW